MTQELRARLKLIATCGIGLEEVLAAELVELGHTEARPERGAVTFEGDWAACWRANWRLRTANRVLIELASWSAADDRSLAEGIQGLVEGRSVRGGSLMMEGLAALLVPERSFSIQASSSASSVTDTRWIAQRVKDGICDGQRQRWGDRSSVDRDDPDLPLRLRLHRDRATLLLDSSGEPLDRRGYRIESGAAPVRETLGAACVLASGWDGRGPVVDPMCGTGTLLIEASWVALGVAPGSRRRRWAFARFPVFDPQVWQGIQQEAIPSPDPQIRAYGNDRDPLAVRACRTNMVAARIPEAIRVRKGDARKFHPPGPRGLLLCNPPHGERLAAPREFYAGMGRWLRSEWMGWRVVLLVGERTPWRALEIEPTRGLPVRNGPLGGDILVLDLPAGRL